MSDYLLNTRYKVKKILLFFILLFLSGCSDDSKVYIQDEKILHTKLNCMRLVIFPPNNDIEKTLKSLYHFKDNCKYKMVVSYKNSLVCNSNQNVDKKILGMPKSYLRLEIKKQNHLYYTYYKDLKDNIKNEDVKKGFNVILKDLKLGD